MSNYTITSPLDILGTGGSPGQINFSNGTNSVQIQAPPNLSSNVNFILPSTNGTASQVMTWNGSGNLSWGTATSTTSFPVTFRFSDTNGNPVTITSSTFTALANMVYRGTSVDGNITSVLCVVAGSNSSTTGQVRLYDVTNATVIATSATFGPTNGSKIVLNLGTISNLPASQAILEIQLRRVSIGSGNTQLFTVQIYG
jgi:hypothetical protein